jgi:cell wall-associated NlpC family hydrolase
VHRVGVTALALSLVTGLGGVAAASADPSTPVGHHVYPSRQQVSDARHRAAHAADDVAGVKAALVQADLRLQAASVRAEQAAESYNGARWHLQQAKRDARVADRHAAIASADATHQRRSYAATVVASYEMGPSLSPLAAVTGATGLSGVITRMSTLQNAQDAMDHTYDSFRASSTLAGVASMQARTARAHAAVLATRALQARDRAAAAAAAAAGETQAIAAQKTRLIQHLARLEHVTVSLAEARQAGIEQAAREAAQQAAEAAARRAAARAAAQRAALAAAHRAQQAAAQQAQQSTGSNSGPTDTPPTSVPTPGPTGPANPPAPPTPQAPPAPASGASAAISFARQQIGDPYVWGAAGPGSWDCSGLTMGAWRAGGISLPHYAAAQYQASTPISSGSLEPGDLVFWGSSGSPSSIYHVALYVGNGMIIQAPRTGRDVEEVSMYSWIAPNFFARP